MTFTGFFKELFEFLKSFRTIRRDWPSKTPKQKWQFIYNIGRFASDLTGIRVLSDLRIYWFTFIPGAFIVLYALLAIHTMFYYTLAGRFLECLPCTCMFGLATSGFSGYVLVITEPRFELNRIARFSGEKIYRDSKEPDAYNKLCSNRIDGTMKRYIFTISLIVFSIALASMGPMYAYFHDGIRSTMLGVKLPYFEEGSDVEFLLVVGLQSVAGVMALIGNIALEACAALAIDTIGISVDLSDLDLEELIGEIKDDRGTGIKAKILLRNILMKIEDIDSHISSQADVMYWRFFLAPVTFTYSISVSIYCQYIMGFPAGYGLAVMSYVQLLIMCLMGHSALDRNDAVLHKLCDFPWYLLSPKIQMMIGQEIHRLQNGVTLTIGPFQTLSLATASILTRRVYSFLMFLMSYAQ